MPKLDFFDALPLTVFFAPLFPLNPEAYKLSEIERQKLDKYFSDVDLTRCNPIFITFSKKGTSVILDNSHFDENFKDDNVSDKPLSDVSPKDKIWDNHRASSDLIKESYLRLGYERYAERIEQCSTLLEFGKVISNDELVYKLLNAHFCRHRHCIVCQWRKTLKWTARFLSVLPTILNDYPKHRFLFLTLTIKNCSVTDLRETINLMNVAWKRLIQRKCFPAEGFIKSLEVTRSKDGLAHPHFHILMMVPRSYFSKPGGYISQAKWIELWKSCLKVNYSPSVNIKSVKEKSETSIVDALKEILKYSLKPTDLIVDTQKLTPLQVKDKDEWLGHLTQQLHKVRTISLGGIFKQYLSDDEPDDLINVNDEQDGLPVSDQRYLFDWMQDLKKYVGRKDI